MSQDIALCHCCRDGFRVRRIVPVLGIFLGKTAPENPRIPLKYPFSDDSTNFEYLTDEIDEFFRFMI